MMSFISFYKRKGPQNLLPSKLACLKGLEMQVHIFAKRIVAWTSESRVLLAMEGNILKMKAIRVNDSQR